MKIFIEGTPFFRRKTGIDYYTLNLINALLEIDHVNKYEVIATRGNRRTPPNLPPRHNLTYNFAWSPPIRIKNRLAKFNVSLPLDLLALGRADITIFPNYYKTPLLFGGKSLVIIYDLSFVLHPEFVAPTNRESLTKAVAKAVESADHILTISRNTKLELMQEYKLPSKMISVVRPAVDRAFFSPCLDSEIAQVKHNHGIEGDYVLFASTLEPRKNVVGLLKAYAKLPLTTKKRFSLVLAGGQGWLDEDITATIKRLRTAGESIITTGYVEDNELPSLYSGATAFIYPSFYEGFGIPILEAMACGTPVITSNTSSLPEAAGKAALLIDPYNVKELSESMDLLLNSPKLQTSLIARGDKQASKFSWPDSASKLLKIIMDLG